MPACEAIQFSVDPAFRDQIPPLSPESLANLREAILRDGCRDPLVVWEEDGLLLDGHHRYAICEECGVEYDVVAVSLPDREAAEDWIDRNQIGRRNLTPDQFRYYLGRLYERRKGKQGGTGANQHTKEQSTQNGNSANDAAGKTAEKLADEHGVSKNTVLRAEKFAKEVDANPELKQAVLAGGKAKPHVLHNSGNNEWYTPERFVQMARQVLGTIELDPASSQAANEVVGAERFYTAEDDGLSLSWEGKVWMNPPYAQPLISQFCDKLAEEYSSGSVTEAVVLVNNATETKWFQSLLAVASAACFLRGRIQFWQPDATTATGLQGQAILYLGDRTKAFADAFMDSGVICYVASNG